MAEAKRPFDVRAFLSSVDGGRTISTYQTKQKIYSQGDSADAVFYIQKGKVKVCIISELGKEAVVALHDRATFLARAV